MDLVQAVTEKFATGGARTVAKMTGVHLATVYRTAKKLGINCMGNAYRAARQDRFNINYFGTWSPSMSYILGFLFADGSCTDRSVVIDVTRTDEAVLEFIHQELQVQLPLSRYHYPRSTTKPFTRLRLCSTVLVRSLNDLGMFPRKTFRDDPVPNVPENLRSHFIRGYFDGDGTVSVSKKGSCSVGFIGTYKLVSTIVDWLVAGTEMIQKEVKQEKGIRAEWSKVCWTHKNDLRAFYEFVYPVNFGFCLERKRTKLDSWLSRPRDPKFCPKKYLRNQ